MFVVIFGYVSAQSLDHASPLRESVRGGLGGPMTTMELEASAVFGLSSITDGAIVRDGSARIVNNDAVLGVSDPLSNLIPTRDGLKKYKVRAGDTLSDIAAQFGISLETLKLANAGVKGSIHVGQELIILPVTGLLYEVIESDSIESIASRYRIDANLIRDYNENYQKIFSEGSGTIVLPYAKPITRADYAGSLKSTLPNLQGYFSLPAVGWNWGELHDYNAVDIANTCGTTVRAAADGLVVPDDTLGRGSSGWNNGYGLFVLVEHTNGTKTRYAHLSKINVDIGDFVSRGEEIGAIGNTGNTHGPTGCHLHFEVYGARNPFSSR